MNGPVIFISKVTKLQPRLRCNNLVTRYVFPEGYCVIPNKSAYMDNNTWAKVVKLLSPDIRKIKGSNVACVIPILLYIYLTLHLCTSKFSS